MKRILIAIAVVFGIMVMTGCSSVSTAPDEASANYNDGSFTSKSFQDCTGRSKRVWDGPGDQHYVYPAGQRTFSFTGAEGSEHSPMPVTTGSQEVLIPGFVTFTLNTDCDTLRKFHETIGNKYGAYKGGGGWDDFLNDYIAVPLSATLNEAAGAIDIPKDESVDQSWYHLYTNAKAQQQFEEYVHTHLPTEIENTLGSEFIEVNAVSISKPAISDNLKSGLAQKEEARLANEAQKERNAQVRTQYDTIKDCLNTGLDRQSCTLIFLSQNGADIPFLPVPQGGAVNFNTN